MNIGFVFTNFNNSSYTRGAVKSLEQSAHSERYSIVVVDNRSEPDDIVSLEQLEKDFPRIVVIYNEENVGYFKGLNVGIKYLQESDLKIDCMVIGNNDLVFPGDFYDKMLSCESNIFQYAVVSPDLITLDGVHQNPHVKSAISSFREFVWDLYYLNYFFALFIGWVAKVTRIITERKDYVGYQEGGVIYQGYGACYILTPVFFDNFQALWAPTFLMGEEYFLWKQLSDKSLEIYYEPTVVVEHHDHATTDKVPGRKLWEICRESHLVYKQYKS